MLTKQAAQWTLHEGYVQCTACGYEPYFLTLGQLRGIKYCPNCGRRMCDYHGKPITDKTTTF